MNSLMVRVEWPTVSTSGEILAAGVLFLEKTAVLGLVFRALVFGITRLTVHHSVSLFNRDFICNPYLIPGVYRLHAFREQDRAKKTPKAGQTRDNDNGA
jgi:hypothetical protein